MPVVVTPNDTLAATRDRPAAGRSGGSGAPVLDRGAGATGRRLALLPGAGRPVATFVAGVLGSWAAIAALSIALGIVVTHAILRSHGVAHDDERLVAFLARHRSKGLTDASLVGSMIAGGVVLPIVAGVYVIAMAILRRWRLAAFVPCALLVESGSYRATTLAVHRHRPEVPRLEQLPVNASYPSGHTAASIAVYGGLALLATSRLSSRPARALVWLVAALIPVYVAGSRLYRGMHHPIDVAGGAVIGFATLAAMVVVARAAGLAAAERRAR